MVEVDVTIIVRQRYAVSEELLCSWPPYMPAPSCPPGGGRRASAAPLRAPDADSRLAARRRRPAAGAGAPGAPAGRSSIPYARAAARIPRARAGSDENIGKTNRIACRVRPKSSTGGQKIHGGGTHPWRNPIPLPPRRGFIVADTTLFGPNLGTVTRVMNSH